MAYEYKIHWLEQPAVKVKFREQAHTYKCQNQELLLGRVGTVTLIDDKHGAISHIQVPEPGAAPWQGRYCHFN
jgi:hypothetical protein